MCCEWLQYKFLFLGFAVLLTNHFINKNQCMIPISVLFCVYTQYLSCAYSRIAAIVNSKQTLERYYYRLRNFCVQIFCVLNFSHCLIFVTETLKMTINISITLFNFGHCTWSIKHFNSKNVPVYIINLFDGSLTVLYVVLIMYFRPVSPLCEPLWNPACHSLVCM